MNVRGRTLTLLAAVVLASALVAASITYLARDGGPAQADRARPLPASPDSVGQQSAVARSDYDAAVDAYLACVAEAGFTTYDTPAFGLRPKRPEVRVPKVEGESDRDTIQRADKIQKDCSFRTFDAVSAAWNEQHVPSFDEQQDLTERMRACLAADVPPATGAPPGASGAFVSYADGPSPLEIEAAQFPRLRDCGLAIEAATGFMPLAVEVIGQP